VFGFKGVDNRLPILFARSVKDVGPAQLDLLAFGSRSGSFLSGGRFGSGVTLNNMLKTAKRAKMRNRVLRLYMFSSQIVVLDGRTD
jgi:hypothetical protein